MCRRQRANRVGNARIACDHECLAAASAEIDGLSRAASARLDHPVIAAGRVQRWRISPDFGKPPVAYVVECEVGNHFRRMAGPNFARGINADIAVAPSAHAGLRLLTKVIRAYKRDFELSATALACLAHDALGALVLLMRGKQ